LKTVEIMGKQSNSMILIGESLHNLETHVPVEKAVIITDTNVLRYYQKDFPPYDIIEIGTGEQVKTLDTVRKIYERLLQLEVDRSSFIIGIGGGIVSDVAGFAASTYMRGIRFGFVSTTLLSQVDASVGGKNGVNFRGYKNIMGMVNQPEFVVCDMNLLKTLPEREVLCGLAEIVKHGAIADEELFSFLEEHDNEALALEADTIQRLVYDSVVIKTALVNKDEREDGERKKLNFGHTFGHAIEKVTGIQHGEAVSAGMVVAARLSENRGNISPADTNRIEALLRKLKLPTELPLNKIEVLDALKKDKKRKGDFIDFVLLRGIGNAVLEEISISELEAVVVGQ